jgi:hypothetical protein
VRNVFDRLFGTWEPPGGWFQNMAGEWMLPQQTYAARICEEYVNETRSPLWLEEQLDAGIRRYGMAVFDEHVQPRPTGWPVVHRREDGSELHHGHGFPCEECA